MIVGLAAVALDLILNMTLIWPFAERGLASSTAISASLQVVCLAWLIQKRVGPARLAPAGRHGDQSAAGDGRHGGRLPDLAPVSLLGSGTLLQGTALLVAISLAILAYFAVARCLGIEELSLLFQRDRDPDNSDGDGNDVSIP